MSSSQPPPSPKQNGEERDTDNQDQGDSKNAPTLGETTKKKSRLQWDEENLIHNAAEMERAGPRMKIDEPKTPYNMLSSENGSSTSGSAHQSPPESPSFIPREHLVGFGALEQGIRRRNSTGNTSDGASSVSSAGRSVHIDDNREASAGSSPRSRELFAARRRAHYRNEARVKEWIRVNEYNDDDDSDNRDNDDANDDDDDDDPCDNAIKADDTNNDDGANIDVDGHTDSLSNHPNHSSANGTLATNGLSNELDANIQTNGATGEFSRQNGSADFVRDQGCGDDHVMTETTDAQPCKLRERPLDQTNGSGKETDVTH